MVIPYNKGGDKLKVSVKSEITIVMDGSERNKLLKYLDLAKADKRATIERLEKDTPPNTQLVLSHQNDIREINDMIKQLIGGR